jgi:Tol biopolymer transport system component
MSSLRPATLLILSALLAGCAGAGTAAIPTGSSAPPADEPSEAANTPVVVTLPPSTPAPTFAPSLPASTARPTVSPEEAWLAYPWYPQSLFLVRPDGSDRHRLDLAAPGEPQAISWSPDGERLVFAMRDAANPNGTIWTANADGTDAKPFYDGNGDCGDGAFWPRWAPDGRRLALVCYDAEGDLGRVKLSVLDTTTMERTDVVTVKWPEFLDNPPSWSPDGKAIVFDLITWDPTDTFVQSSVVATVPAAGGDIERLTDPAMFGAHPDFSPDGSLIAFSTYDTGSTHGIEEPSNVYLVAPDGSGLRQLSTASMDGKMRLGQPFWSSDGTRIWVSIGRDWEKDSTGQPKNTLGWVDATTGELTEIGTEGKRFIERP